MKNKTFMKSAPQPSPPSMQITIQ